MAAFVTDLTAAPRPLWDGSSLQGWHAIGKGSWKIEDGNKQKLQMRFDGNSPWNAEGTGFHFDDKDAGLEFTVHRSELGNFMQEFRQSSTLYISFTGSTEVGKKLIAGAAAQVKPLSLELGGHSPVLIFDDADLAKAVEGTMIAKYRNTGQSCIAANRIYVQRGIAAQFIPAFVERVKALKVGNGLEPGVEIGPLINAAAVDLALKHIADAQAQGAQLLCGGKRIGDAGSAFLEPTVLTGVPGASLGMCDETFAPVAYVNVFDTEAEALARANDTSYGLAAYVFTRDLSRAFRLMESLEAGMLGINDGVPTTSNAPFGGVKQSGWGRELGSEGLDAFLETKHVSLVI